jgi:YD repeat-containing protein
MRVQYDRETDTLTVIFAEVPAVESDEDKPGTILDYDASGNLVSIEILDASRRVGLPTRIEYQVVPVGA